MTKNIYYNQVLLQYRSQNDREMVVGSNFRRSNFRFFRRSKVGFFRRSKVGFFRRSKAYNFDQKIERAMGAKSKDNNQ
jgi:hypothetical protein